EAIKTLNDIQRDFVKLTGKEVLRAEEIKDEYNDLPAPEELINLVKRDYKEKIKEGMFVDKDKDTNRSENMKAIKAQISEVVNKDEETYSDFEIESAVEYVARKI